MNRRTCAARLVGAAAGMSVVCTNPLAFAQAVQKPEHNWQLATGYRAESFHTVNLLQFAKEVDQASAGAIRIEVVPNNALVKLAEIPQAVQSGRIAAGEVILSGMAKDLPLAGADSVPFVVNGYADARRMWRLQRPGLEREMAKRGLTVLYAVPWPPQGLYTTQPVKQAADLKGTRMRTYNPTTVRIAELLGASSLDVPMVQVAQALAEGRMNAMITSAVTGVENKVWTGLKHHYEISAWIPKNMVFVQTQRMAALKPAQRSALLEAANAAEARGWDMSERAAQTALEELKRNGMTVERPSAQLDRELKRLGERFSREWVREVGVSANEIFIPYYTEATSVAAK